jgi:hypothetical protein
MFLCKSILCRAAEVTIVHQTDINHRQQSSFARSHDRTFCQRAPLHAITTGHQSGPSIPAAGPVYGACDSCSDRWRVLRNRFVLPVKFMKRNLVDEYAVRTKPLTRRTLRVGIDETFPYLTPTAVPYPPMNSFRLSAFVTFVGLPIDSFWLQCFRLLSP